MPYSSYILLALLLFSRTFRAINLAILFTHCSKTGMSVWPSASPRPLLISLVALAPLPSSHFTPNHQHDLPISHITTPSPSSGDGTQLLIAVCEHATGMPPT